MNAQGVVIIIGIIVLAFIGFVIYFIFKQLEFVIRAINLYEKMITRQDTMIKLLKDLRGIDNITDQEAFGEERNKLYDDLKDEEEVSEEEILEELRKNTKVSDYSSDELEKMGFVYEGSGNETAYEEQRDNLQELAEEYEKIRDKITNE